MLVRRVRLSHVFVLVLLVLELVAYFSLAYQSPGGKEHRDGVAVAAPTGEGGTGGHNDGAWVSLKKRDGPDNSCIAYPNQTKCVNYQLPSADADVKNLCGMMPHMGACSVNNLCASHGGRLKPSQYCAPFSILKDICTSDMSKMSGCNNYTSMCGPTDSVVKECSMETLPLPSDAQLTQWITQMCNEMPMDACKQCNLNKDPAMLKARALNCDLLLVYSNLCLSMPDMQQCSGWSQLCNLIPTWPICPSSSGDEQPIMRMYFHTGLVDYVLFKEWVPRNWWEYTGTFLAIVVLGILYEGLKTARSIAEETWAADKKRKQEEAQNEVLHNEVDPHHHHGNGQVQDEETEEVMAVIGGPRTRLGGWTVEWVPFNWAVDLPRALFVFVEIATGLVLMLIAMTFNVGLFLAVCVGGFCGSLIFGRFSATYSKSLCH